MGKKMTRAGMIARRAVRAELDATPDIDHVKIRSKYKVAEGIIESAMTRSVAEWDAIIAATPEDLPAVKREHPIHVDEGTPLPDLASSPSATMPGIEQGIIKFTRKPAKMGDDFIFWIPRVYIKNGLVDSTCTYEIYLKKRPLA